MRKYLIFTINIIVKEINLLILGNRYMIKKLDPRVEYILQFKIEKVSRVIRSSKFYKENFCILSTI